MKTNITFGKTYVQKYLDPKLGKLGTVKHQGLITLDRKKTNYGYLITQGTNFISIYKTKLFIFKDGTAKSVTKVEKNYSSPYQFTCYYDKNGREIKDKFNRTRSELHYFKTLKN